MCNIREELQVTASTAAGNATSIPFSISLHAVYYLVVNVLCGIIATRKDLMQYYKLFQEDASKLTHAIEMYT